MAEAVLAAMGIALSPFAVLPAILLLFTPRPAAASGSFAGGWYVGVAVVTLAAVAVADLLTLPEVSPRWVSWARVVLGLALLVAGGAKLVRRSPDPQPPGWFTSLQEADPRRALRFGLVASAPNPKVALLAVAGGFALGAELHGLPQELAGAAAFALLATLTALVPVVAYLVLGERAVAPLSRARDWLTARLDVVMSVVLLVIGVLVLWKGAGALLA